MKSRIFLKLFAASLVLIAACTLTMNVLIQKAWEGMLRSEIESSLREKTLLFASRVANAPRESLPAIAKQAARDSDERATVIDSNGNVLADSEADPSSMENHAGRPEFASALQGQLGVATRASHTVGVDFLYEAAPFPGGAVRLAHPLSAIRDANRHVRKDLLKSSAVAALIALVLAFIATQSIGRRLARITDFAERVAAGDLSARIEEESTDEIAHVASALDKTARKLEEGFRTVESSRQTLETLLNSMQEAVIAVAEDGRVLWANHRMERLLPSGIRLGEPLVQSARDPEILRAVQTALDSRDITVARAAKIFSGRIFDVTAAPMPGGGVVAVMHDQTEVERVEKTRRDFIANVSHELRTPLTSIQGYAETVLENEELSESTREFVEIIRKNALRMSRLTEDLLVLARVESGERGLQLESATPQELLEEAVQTFQEIADGRGIELAVMNTANSAVMVDRDAIHQVFGNLIDNAMKYGEG
ncbi:MAG TPA: histidine kinase dimerization/phospho-acceptor domain-containing protein, partial [Candidatus Limnocylindrales bacterium]|nr:histidine kinase dimerization/phospho-acceptor domain-containing protein [Candidatus Limnocylindrales bacterium]